MQAIKKSIKTAYVWAVMEESFLKANAMVGLDMCRCFLNLEGLTINLMVCSATSRLEHFCFFAFVFRLYQGSFGINFNRAPDNIIFLR